MHSLGVGMERVCPLLGLTLMNDPELDSHDGAKTLPLILGILFGAFAGLLAGLILARIVGFVAYLLGKEFEGRGLIVITMLAGAGLGAWLVLCRGVQ